MKKIFILISIMFLSINAMAITASQVAGTYSLRYQLFSGQESPQQGSYKLQLNADATWAVMCHQTYGGHTYYYPCEGMLYTWYIESGDSLYPIRLNFNGNVIKASFSGTGDLLAFVPFEPISILMSRDNGDIVHCDSMFTPIFDGNIPSEGGAFKFVYSDTIETCYMGSFFVDGNGASVERIQLIKTGEALITVNFDNTTESRDFLLQNSNGTRLIIHQEGDN